MRRVSCVEKRVDSNELRCCLATILTAVNYIDSERDRKADLRTGGKRDKQTDGRMDGGERRQTGRWRDGREGDRQTETERAQGISSSFMHNNLERL